MEKKTRFLMLDGAMTRNAYRIDMAGLDIAPFLKNPVLFFGHDSWRLPIGRWADVTLENGRLTGTPVFDTNDPMGKEVARKVGEGFLSACSVGLFVKAAKPGVIEKCELLECSIVNVPAHPGAVKLSFAPGAGMPIEQGPFTSALSIIEEGDISQQYRDISRKFSKF